MVMLGSQQRPGDDFRQYHVQTLILKLHGWEIFLCRIMAGDYLKARQLDSQTESQTRLRTELGECL